jgi:hypothetical protein
MAKVRIFDVIHDKLNANRTRIYNELSVTYVKVLL